MRVLALTTIFPNPFQPNRGPYTRHQLANMHSEHEVRVISPISWTNETRALRAGKPALPANRRVEVDGIVVDHPRYYYPPKIGHRWHGRFYEWSVKRTFLRAVEEFSPDVVFSPWPYPDGWAALRLARRAGLPVVVKCIGSDVLQLDKHPSRRQRTIEAVCGADGVIAVSRHMAVRLIELGVSPERLHVVIDGVDRTRFCPGDKGAARARLGLSADKRIVLFVGNLVEVKAVDVLLKAWRGVSPGGDVSKLIIVGDGPLRPELERQAESMELRPSVEFRGAIPHENLPDWFRAADAFVLASRSEGVPNVLLEASACDTPWVATNVGGIPEIADLGRSKLVSPDQVDELSDALRDILMSPPVGSPAEPRTWEQSAKSLAEFLKAVSKTSRTAELSTERTTEAVC